MTGAPTSPIPRCPRCGYDQTGLIDSWTLSCPLEAICTECGYGFDPRDAIDPTRRRLPWLYEHAEHWWSVRAWIRTVLMLLWPPAFWKRVRPEHEVRAGRIVAILVWPYVLMFLALLLLALAEHITGGRTQYSPYQPPQAWNTAITNGLGQFGRWLTSSQAPGWFLERLPIGFALAALAFVWLPVVCAFFAIPSEWAGTPLRRKHLVRLSAYAALPFMLIPHFGGIWNLGIHWYQIVYYLQPLTVRNRWPKPWDIDLPGLRFLLIGLTGFTLLWPALYWFSAIRWGYRLPSTLRPMLIVLAVLLTPWTLFLVYTAYYEFIA